MSGGNLGFSIATMRGKRDDDRIGERHRRSDPARQRSQAFESIAPLDGCVTRFVRETDRHAALGILVECEVYLLARTRLLERGLEYGLQ